MLINYIIIGLVSFCAGVLFWQWITNIKISTLRRMLGYKFEHNELERKLMNENKCLAQSIYEYEDYNLSLIKDNGKLKNRLGKIREITYYNQKNI